MRGSVGTPLAMDAYAAPYSSALVDSLHIYTELYTMLALRCRFYFAGSAASGGGQYGGANSGNAELGFSQIPCFAPNATSNYLNYIKTKVKSSLCNDPAAKFVLLPLNACGVAFALYKNSVQF